MADLSVSRQLVKHCIILIICFKTENICRLSADILCCRPPDLWLFELKKK